MKLFRLSKKSLVVLLGIGILFLGIIGFILYSHFTVKRNVMDTPISTPAPSPRPTPVPLVVKVSIPYWDQVRASASFRDNVERVDYINLFWYYLKYDGSIVKYQYAQEDTSIIDFAHKKGVKVLAVVTNLPEGEGEEWDSARVESVITDEELRAVHIDNIVWKLTSLDFDGVIIDYESVDAPLRDEFTVFIKELSGVLQAHDKLLAVSLHPKTLERGERSLGAFQDWKALARWADHLHIMAFNEHWNESEVGPVASIGWMKKILEYADGLSIPPEKLHLVLPLFGYDWNLGHEDSAKGLTYSDVEGLMVTYGVGETWDEAAKSPYIEYEKDGHIHEVWYENARSISEKVLLALDARLGGISFWRLGGEDPAIWQAVGELR